MASGAIKKSKSALFLIELIIAILFFALASAICIQLFVKAHLISQRSGDTTGAVLQAETAAETWRGGAFDGIAGAPIYYDADWNALGTPQGAVYELTLAETREDGGMARASIDVRRVGAQEALYTLQAGVYTGGPHAAN